MIFPVPRQRGSIGADSTLARSKGFVAKRASNVSHAKRIFLTSNTIERALPELHEKEGRPFFLIAITVRVSKMNNHIFDKIDRKIGDCREMLSGGKDVLNIDTFIPS